MIGSLRGTVQFANADGEILLDVGGVGYAVHVPTRLHLNGECFLFTHLHVREDLMVLYGFETAQECQLFRLLIGTTGVGPKLAMTMLSVLTANELRAAVANEDTDRLVAVPGIGKRTAQRLMIELRSRLGEPDASDDALASTLGHSGIAEARAALEGLGYRPDEIREAMLGLEPSLSSEVIVKEALRSLGRAT